MDQYSHALGRSHACGIWDWMRCFNDFNARNDTGRLQWRAVMSRYHQAKAKLGPSLRIGCTPAGVIVGRARNEPRPKAFNQFLCGLLFGHAVSEKTNPLSDRMDEINQMCMAANTPTASPTPLTPYIASLSQSLRVSNAMAANAIDICKTVVACAQR